MSSKVKLPAYMMPMGEILKTSTKTLIGNSGHIFGLLGLTIAYVAIIAIIYGILAFSANFFTVIDSPMTTPTFNSSTSIYSTSGSTTIDISVLGIITSVVFFVILMLGTGYLGLMLIRSINAQYEGKPMTFGAAFDAAKHRYVPYLLTVLLVALITGGPSFIAQGVMSYYPIIGAIIYIPVSIFISIFSLYLSFAQYTAALEGTSVINSLKASYWVVRGRWWTIVGYSILLVLLMVGIMVPFMIPFVIFRHWVATIPALVVLVLISAFYAVFIQILYYRLRDTAAKKPADFPKTVVAATPAPAPTPAPETPAAS